MLSAEDGEGGNGNKVLQEPEYQSINICHLSENTKTMNRYTRTYRKTPIYIYRKFGRVVPKTQLKTTYYFVNENQLPIANKIRL